MVRVEYSSNNSGGRWWLKDADWLKLEGAGWRVEWGGKYFCHSRFLSLSGRQEGKPEPCASEDNCSGHPMASSFEEAKQKNFRWLGSLAKRAEIECESPLDAIRSFEKATGQTASNEGCNCCGPPHSFSWGEGNDRGYASGDEIVELLYPGSPKTLREAAESRLQSKGGLAPKED